jgi:hypothetical protein
VASAILVPYCGAVLELSAIDRDPVATALAFAERLPEEVGPTEPMAIESMPVHETAEEWQADR